METQSICVCTVVAIDELHEIDTWRRAHLLRETSQICAPFVLRGEPLPVVLLIGVTVAVIVIRAVGL